jgi:hypothetical protein
MHNSQEKGLTMSRQLLVKGCKTTKGRWIAKVGGLPMVRMDLLMEMVYKPLVEVHTK